MGPTGPKRARHRELLGCPGLRGRDMGASRLPGPEKARHRELQGCPMAGADLMSYCVTYLRTRKA